MSKHTPGPWFVGYKHFHSGVWTRTGDLIANTHQAYRNFMLDEHIAEQDANANLIAAAPDLLEALMELRSYYIETTGLPPVAANKAINKAKGETP